ncbi:hypothetical protein [Citrobacter portucalensis]|uniref:hypothetical protein n=1 Tax=Citrobacter portucalensis TaxID=1639133 RepID=UPI003A83764C
MANPNPSKPFSKTNQPTKRRGKSRHTELFQELMDDRGAVVSITNELLDMFFSDSIPIKEKRMIGEFLLNKLVISAEKQTDVEIAVIESKSKEELIAELLNKAGSNNEHIPAEGVVPTA